MPKTAEKTATRPTAPRAWPTQIRSSCERCAIVAVPARRRTSREPAPAAKTPHSPKIAAASTHTRDRLRLPRKHPSAPAPFRISDTRPAQFAQSPDPSGRFSARLAHSMDRTRQPMPVLARQPRDACVRAPLEQEHAPPQGRPRVHARAHAPFLPCPEPPETSPALAQTAPRTVLNRTNRSCPCARLFPLPSQDPRSFRTPGL